MKPGEQHLCCRAHMALVLSSCLCLQQPRMTANQTTAGAAEPSASSPWDCLCEIRSLKNHHHQKSSLFDLSGLSPTNEHTNLWAQPILECPAPLSSSFASTAEDSLFSIGLVGKHPKGKPDFLVSPQITHGMAVGKDEHL